MISIFKEINPVLRTLGCQGKTNYKLCSWVIIFSQLKIPICPNFISLFKAVLWYLPFCKLLWFIFIEWLRGRRRDRIRRWLPKNSIDSGEGHVPQPPVSLIHYWIFTTCFSGGGDTAALQRWAGMPRGLCFGPILLVYFLSCFFLLCFCFSIFWS